MTKRHPLPALLLWGTLIIAVIAQLLVGHLSQIQAAGRVKTSLTASRQTTQKFTVSSDYKIQPIHRDAFTVVLPKEPSVSTVQAYAQSMVISAYASANIDYANQVVAYNKAVSKQHLMQAKAVKHGKTYAAEKLHKPASVKPTDHQWTCLSKLWTQESSWSIYAKNKDSGAYGIPQALPASKLKVMGKDWWYNYKKQVQWGWTYISDRYGSPCGAWKHEVKFNWY